MEHSRPSTILPLYLDRATAASPGRVKETTAIPLDFPWLLYTMRTSFTGPTVLENRVCPSSRDRTRCQDAMTFSAATRLPYQTSRRTSTSSSTTSAGNLLKSILLPISAPGFLLFVRHAGAGCAPWFPRRRCFWEWYVFMRGCACIATAAPRRYHLEVGKSASGERGRFWYRERSECG